MTLICLMVKHDPSCPGANGDPANCNCTPDYEFMCPDDFFQDLRRVEPKKQGANSAESRAKNLGVKK